MNVRNTFLRGSVSVVSGSNHVLKPFYHERLQLHEQERNRPNPEKYSPLKPGYWFLIFTALVSAVSVVSGSNHILKPFLPRKTPTTRTKEISQTRQIKTWAHFPRSL